MNLQLPFQEQLGKSGSDKVSNQQDRILLEEVAGFEEKE
jgi:hypothetical protein